MIHARTWLAIRLGRKLTGFRQNLSVNHRLDAWDHRKVTGPKHELIGKSPTARNKTAAGHAKTGGKTALIGEIPVTSPRPAANRGAGCAGHHKPPVIFWVSHGDFRALDETKTQTSIISWSVKGGNPRARNRRAFLVKQPRASYR